MCDSLEIEILEVKINALEIYFSGITDKHEKLICLELLSECYLKFSKLNKKKGTIIKSKKWTKKS